MDLYGLIGFPLGHSFSKIYFTEKFAKEGIAAQYGLFPLRDISELPDLIASHPKLRGFNVTIPYKEKVIDFLNGLSDEARAIGAVNVVKISDGKLTGYNTDCPGFADALRPLLHPGISKALVLGSGGASKAVCHALRLLKIEPLVVSRTPKPGQVGYDELPHLMADHLLIVNATPVGTFPDTDVAPQIPYEMLTPKHLCFDLVYNPSETLFMRKAAEHGAAVSNGLVMLHRQAERAWEIWSGEE